MSTKKTKINQITVPDQINYVSLSRAHVALWYQFQFSIRSIIDISLAMLLNLKAIYEVYTELFMEADAAFKTSQAFEETKKINKLDRDRDNLFVAIFDTIRLHLRLPDATTRIAAEHLQFVLKPYAKSYQAPLDEETALITNMIDDLRKAENAQAVAKLNLGTLITQLEGANVYFDEVYTQRIDVKVARAAIDNLVTLRPQVDEVYRALVQAINGKHVANEYSTTSDVSLRAILTDIINKVNGQIIQFEQNIANVNRKPAEKKPEKS